jgi:hypothetical protein
MSLHVTRYLVSLCGPRSELTVHIYRCAADNARHTEIDIRRGEKRREYYIGGKCPCRQGMERDREPK